MFKWISALVALAAIALFNVKHWPQNKVKEYVLVWKNSKALEETIRVLGTTDFERVWLFPDSKYAEVKIDGTTNSILISDNSQLSELKELLLESDLDAILAVYDKQWFLSGLQLTIKLSANEKFQSRWVENVRYLYLSNKSYNNNCKIWPSEEERFGECHEDLLNNWKVLNEWKLVERAEKFNGD